jgi:putative ABC transport system permease protein
MTVVVRTAGDPLEAVSLVRRAVREADPDQPLAEVRRMEDAIAESTAGARFNSVLLAVFAVVAFTLAAVGIYGVMAHGVAERTGEIGIRVALGADAGDIAAMVLREGAVLAGLGIALGLVAALALTRMMASMLYTVRSFDAATYASVMAALTLVALAASFLPARRAMKVDPVEALRQG